MNRKGLANKFFPTQIVICRDRFVLFSRSGKGFRNLSPLFLNWNPHNHLSKIRRFDNCKSVKKNCERAIIRKFFCIQAFFTYNRNTIFSHFNFVCYLQKSSVSISFFEINIPCNTLTISLYHYFSRYLFTYSDFTK